MDISEIKPSERVVEILHPATNEKLGIRVSLISINDPRMKPIKRKIQDDKTRLEQRGKFLKAEQVENNQYDVIFSAMTGWEWYNPTGNPGDAGYDEKKAAKFKGKIPEFGKQSVIAVFSEAEWMMDQLASEISEERAFF